MMTNCFKIMLFAALLSFWPSGPAILADQPYQGALFDAHAHLSKRSQAKRAYADFKDAGFGKAVLFAEVNQAKDIAQVGKGFFLVFADPFKRKKVKVDSGGKEVRYQFSEDRLSKIKKALEKGEVLGFGEIYFQLGWAPFAPKGIVTDINGDDAKKLLSVAKLFNAIVHIHLDAQHVEILREILTGNPDVRFVLAHCGFFKPVELGAILDEYPNLYAETSLVFNPYIEQFANLPLEHGKLKADWKAVLLRHADRLMIGTDYTSSRSDQLPKLATYYRQVLGMLPEAKANKIAHENFSRIFMKH